MTYIAYVHDTASYRALAIESDDDREICAARAVAWLRNIGYERGTASTVPQVLCGANIAPHKWLGVVSGHEYHALLERLAESRELARAFSRKAPPTATSAWVHPRKRKVSKR